MLLPAVDVLKGRSLTFDKTDKPRDPLGNTQQLAIETLTLSGRTLRTVRA